MSKTTESESRVSPNSVPVSVQGLADVAGGFAARGPAPVHLWNPPDCGAIDMRIARDGRWFYQGSEIARPAMVRLFASILKREGDEHFLVTPVEKVGITVEDSPFIAVDSHRDGGDLIFRTNLDDIVRAGPDHPLRIAENGAPYVMVRAGLWARIDRKSWLRLVDLAEIRGPEIGVTSAGAFFPLGPAA